MAYRRFSPFDSSLRTTSPPFTVNNAVPEYGYRDWDVISHFEEAPPIVNKPSIFRRFIRAILGINLLFGPHFDSIEETLKKRKSNRGRSTYLPWKSFFDSEDTVIERKPVPNNQTAFEVFWPPNSPTLRRIPGSPVVPKPQIPPIEELIKITRQPTPLSLRHRYDITVKAPQLSFQEPIATTTLPEFSVPPTPAPQPNTTISSHLISFTEAENAEHASSRSSLPFLEGHIEHAEITGPLRPYSERYVEHAEYAGPSRASPERYVDHAGYAGPSRANPERYVESSGYAGPSRPYPERHVEHAEYAGPSSLSYDLERHVEHIGYAGPSNESHIGYSGPSNASSSGYSGNHFQHADYAGPSRSYPERHIEHAEYAAGPSTSRLDHEDNRTRSSTPETPAKSMIFTSRVRFPLALGVNHVTYKLREKPPPRDANILRRPSWATITSSLYSYVGNLEEELDPSAGPSLQFPTISFSDDNGLIGYHPDPEPEPEVEEEEQRPMYDVQFWDYEGGKCLALADFEVPEGYDEEFASVEIDYGKGGERIAMDGYVGGPDEEMKMRDSGAVVFLFLPIEE